MVQYAGKRSFHGILKVMGRFGRCGLNCPKQGTIGQRCKIPISGQTKPQPPAHDSSDVVDNTLALGLPIDGSRDSCPVHIFFQIDGNKLVGNNRLPRFRIKTAQDKADVMHRSKRACDPVGVTH